MRIGTRGSALALWQARTVARLLESAGGSACEIVVIKTSGDERPGPPDPPQRPSDTSSTDSAVKRMFVKEIEEALIDGEVDLAVHSCKDLPAVLPDGLTIGAALEREDARDVLILPAGSPARDLASAKEALGQHPRIGTSSVRRRAELARVFPRATFASVRGNVDTRLRKLDSRAECDVLVLAAAGVKRLELAQRISAYLPVEVCLPAPGQGIVAIEIRGDAAGEVRRAVAAISDADAIAALIAERAVVSALGGGCQMPLGAFAAIDGQRLVVDGLVSSLDGRRTVRARATGNRGNPAGAGEKLARLLLDRGASAILADAPGTGT